MKKLFFLGAGLAALGSSPVRAQAGGPEVVMVRVTEYTRGEAQLIIERPGLAPEEVKFDFRANPTKGLSAAGGYMAALKKLYAQGYQLQGVIPGAIFSAANGGFTASTLVFVKPASR